MKSFIEILNSVHLRDHPVQVVYGADILNDLAQYVPDGPLLLLASAGSTRRGITQRITDLLERPVGIFDKVTPNPRLDDLDDWTERFRGERYAGIIAVGGGSVIDSAKVLSITLTGASNRPLHTIFREGNTVRWPMHLPLTVVPTTAGTGAEATPFATVWDTVNSRKHSLGDRLMYPAVALLDPCLTLQLPERETMNTALDTLSHALESLWNRKRTEHSVYMATEALKRVVSALPELIKQPQSLAARAAMLEAAFLGGTAISQTRTAVAHAISYPLTLHFGVPHGLACGFTLRAILEYCLEQNVDLAASQPLLQQVMALLTQLQPEADILKCVDPQKIYALIPEMHAPGRSDNFIMPLDEVLLRSLLRKAIEKS